MRSPRTSGDVGEATSVSVEWAPDPVVASPMPHPGLACAIFPEPMPFPEATPEIVQLPEIASEGLFVDDQGATKPWWRLHQGLVPKMCHQGLGQG